MLNNLLHVDLKLLQKTAQATGDLMRNKIDESQKFRERIIQIKILNMLEKYIEKDIYLWNKDRKLSMI